MSRKTPLNIQIAIEGQHWSGRGGRVSVQGPTLQATKRRVRKSVEETYGAGTAFTIAIDFPTAVRERIERNRTLRDEVTALRARERADTLELMEYLRDKLGVSYEDAAEVLGLDAVGLMRLVHKKGRVNLETEE